jgi:5-methylcytosine-specific restriction endonuclease McrA/biotin operon repressor
MAQAKEAKSRDRNERDRARLLEFFLEHSDVPVSNARLAQVLGSGRGDAWTRRLRELREPRHGGYTIHSRRDLASLGPNEYLFPRQNRRSPQYTVRIKGSVRTNVLFRDAYQCQNCGLGRGEKYDDGRAVTVHVAHNLADSYRGEATEQNCFTLCSRCNEAESNIGPDRPVLTKTMQQVRRLPDHEKREILRYLRSCLDE